MKKTYLFFLLLTAQIGLCQSETAYFLMPKNQNIEVFINNKINQGIKEGVVLDCNCKYSWKITSEDSVTPIISKISEALSTYDLDGWLRHEFYNRRYRGNVKFCGFKIFWNEIQKTITGPSPKIRKPTKAEENSIADFVKLEKIIPLNLPATADNIELYASSYFKEEYWLLHYEKSMNGYLNFLCLNISENKTDTIKVLNPILPETFEKTDKILMSVNDLYLVLSIEKQIFLFDRKRLKLEFHGAFSMETDIGYLGLHEHKVLFAHCSNYSKKDEEFAALASSFDITSKTMSPYISLDFEMPELSFRVPHNWIDFKNGKTIFSQSAKYKVDILSESFSANHTIQPNDEKWKTIPEEIIIKTKELKGKNPEYSKYFFSALPVIDKANRIREAFFVDDSTIIIQITLNDAEKSQYPGVAYFYDVWKYDGSSFKRFYEKLKDAYPYKNVKLNYTNYPYHADNTFYPISRFSNGRAAILKLDSNVKPLGKRYNKVKRMLDKKFYSESPGANLYIYSIKF
jgi:hypothetical protein